MKAALIFYILIGITAVIFLVCLILFCRLQKHRHFVCPHCVYRYKPGGCSAFFARKEDVTKRLLTCPRCNHRNYMENYEDGAPEESRENQ